MTNQRRFSRIQFDSPVTFNLEGQSLHGHVLDISLKGIMMELSEPATDDILGKKGEVIIGEDNENLQIRMTVHCVHVEANCLGLESITIDIDSAGHLRRLIEVNLGSDALLNREMAALVEAYTGN